MVTVLYGTRPAATVAGVVAGEDLWLSPEALAAATGWTLEPEGLCRADVCVPAANGTSLLSGSEVSLTALARLLGQPMVREAAHEVWSFADAVPGPRQPREALDAPDFTLPDLEGRPHALRDYRGRKVFLVSWASW
ncbi:MAG: redoxin domain-containing protein [Candidatus Rokubacteria bacterium]|nr:redoxin domain-containing protein [Candidatus Rokubacteria bacterium]